MGLVKNEADKKHNQKIGDKDFSYY
jgi:hypothetical protein